MKALTDEQAAQWCKDRGFDVYDGCHMRIHGDCRVIDVARITPNCRVLFTGHVLTNPPPCQEPFSGGLVWLREWELGGVPVQAKIIDRIRRSYGVGGWPIKTPGHLFDENEEVDAAMIVSLMLLFQWDGYFAAADGNYLLGIMADVEAVIVASKRKPDELVQALKEFYRVLEARPGDQWYELMVSNDETGKNR
jgi:hypothetical protein